ncbi:MAG: DNA-directed RNA polymerase subunit beta' [Acutalibacteraceae bacterium]|nr:DNA-directed RNA polymerase subunit beta' [Acutalibacteraceae bacterium]
MENIEANGNLTFESIKIGLASPDQIREWSYGEVKKPETINYRTLKPEKEGLFCEKIFGPQKDWECHCGKYKRIRYKGKVCERCGVEITRAKVRRERMGHIELATPVSHIWYFKGVPSRMGLILDISPRDLEKVLYFAKHIVIDPGEGTSLEKYQTLDEKDYEEYRLRYEDDFRAGMGAEAIKELLAEIDLDKLSEELKAEMETASGQKKAKALKRLEVVEAFRQSGNRPEWMILDVVPVLPPEIRPMVQLEGGRFATSDLNDLYRRVINRNNRLKKLMELGSPDIIIRNEKRMLQEAVDALIDNGRRGRPVTGPNNRALKSLSDMLKGKQGRFRQNLLGKRVDYSGRSVIVVGPELKLYQCGLPKEMALELFKPFVMKRLVETEVAGNVKSARKMVERSNPQVWDALEVVIKDHPVMLNRAPTLHRLGIQAFEPVLVEGRAIRLHPLVCTAFNADFDGDQMAVHVPLSAEAQAEARFLMLAANNLLKPSDGRPVAVPTQDMILGSYYLTMVNDNNPENSDYNPDNPYEPGAAREAKDADGNLILDENGERILVYNTYTSVDEAMMAYDEGDIGLHVNIKIRMSKEVDGKTVTQLVKTTLGKVIFNTPVPQDLGFIDRSKPENIFTPEVDVLVNKKMLGKIIDRCIKVHGTAVAADVLDKIKAQGYRYSTRSGITVAVIDATIPPQKKELLQKAESKVAKITRNYERGLITNDERSEEVIKAWEECTREVASELKKNFKKFNPINMMLDSGARGNDSQLRQLAGMRGLIANTAGKTIEVPIKANYREGLNISEYFISSRGARKGLADTALRTADSGYLTRRLVDVSQDVIIRQEDCHCTEGINVYDIYDGDPKFGGRKIVGLAERLTGRFLLEDYIDPATGEFLASKDVMMTDIVAEKVAASVQAETDKKIAAGELPEGAKAQIKIRSLLSCCAEHGVCIKCYGANLATGEPVTVGEAVGIIAAQSIGEPGTQLTMRTFHTGGAADQSDITTGLPRIEELFEARKPKMLAIMSEIDGVVSFREIKKSPHVIVTGDDGDEKTYLIPYGFRVKVMDGQKVSKGAQLTEGAQSPHDILAILGVEAVHDYLIREVQRTYRMQGVDINDKHIEVIVRQMMRKVRIADPGASKFLPGVVVEKMEFRLENERIAKEAAEAGVEPQLATYMPTLMGITKASLATDSFLSAASFQETTRVLTDAAIKGKVDPLMGLKENVIIGKLLPSGTGMKCYNNVEVYPTGNAVNIDENDD